MRCLRLLSVAIACFAAHASAQVFTWTGATDNTWSTATNWLPASVPPSAAATFITFAPATGTLTSVVDAPWTIGGMSIDLPVRTIAGMPITFDGAPFLTVTDFGHTIANDLVLNATLAVTLTDPLTLPGTVTGPGGLTKLGAGNLTLTAVAGFWAGTTTISQGRLIFAGPPTIITAVNNSELEISSPNMGITDPVTGSGAVFITAGTTFGTFNHAGATTIGPGGQIDGTISNNALLALDGDFFTSTSTIGSLAGVGNMNLTGLLTVGGDGTDTLYLGDIFGPGDLTKVGAGRLTLAGSTVNFGTITISGGTLRIGDAGSGPVALVTVVDNAALEIDVNGAGFTNPLTGTGTLTVLPTGSISLGTLNHAGATTIQFGGRIDGAINNNSRLTLDGELNEAGTTVGSLAGAASGLLNLISGNFVSGGDNTSTTYLGQYLGSGDFTKVGSGELVMGAGFGQMFGTTTITGGTLTFGNAPASASTPGLITVVNNGVLRVDRAPSGLAITNPVTGSGSVVVTSGLAFAPSWLHAGSTTIDAAGSMQGVLNSPGALVLDGQLDSANVNVGSIAGAGTLTFAGPPGTFVVGGANTSTTYSGSINNAQSMVKTGTGTLTLNLPNFTTANAVTVAAGSLIVNSTIVAPTTTVNAGAILGGTGNLNFSVNVNAGGTLAPGVAGPGQLATGPLVLRGTLAVDILGTGGGAFDRVVATSSDLAGGTLSLSGAYVFNPGDTVIIISNTSGAATVGTFAGLPEGGTLMFNGRALRITYVGGDGNDVALSLAQFTVTPSAGANGSIAPNTPVLVNSGATTAFTVTANGGYAAVMGGTCGGTLVGTTYTTNAITANCTVDATFTSTAITSFTGPSATGTGSITASFTGGGPTCSYATSQFIPVTGHPASPPAAPGNVTFPHGLFDFTLTGCTPGSTIAMTITYPSALPPGTLYWKYGPTPTSPSPGWYVMPAGIAGAVVTFSVTDGGLGDDDLTANGGIVDQGGPGFPGPNGTVPTPTLSEWMLAVLASLILAAGMISTRRERARTRR